VLKRFGGTLVANNVNKILWNKFIGTRWRFVYSCRQRTVRIERCVKSAALPDFGSRISAAAARTDTLHITCRISQGHFLYYVWTLWDHSFLSYATDSGVKMHLLSMWQVKTFHCQNHSTSTLSQGHVHVLLTVQLRYMLFKYFCYFYTRAGTI